MNSRVAGFTNNGVTELFSLLERIVECKPNATRIYVHHLNETALTILAADQLNALILVL
jgi:hypothetical protein